MSDAPRHVAVIGPTRTGKTLFTVENARADIYAIDPEQALKHYTDLAAGKIFWPTRKGRIDPLTITREAEARLWDMKEDTTIVVDSMSRIYASQSRKASMAQDMTADQREEIGLPRNAASLMKGKSNAIQAVGGLSSFGMDLYIIWHSGAGLIVEQGRRPEMGEKESISQKERDVLLRDIDIVLNFSVDGPRYMVTVSPDTRGRGRKRARTGFTVTDPEDNFWEGTMGYLEELIYLHFESPDHAQQWAAEGRLKGHDDIAGLYETAKEAAAKKAGRDRAKFDASYMWFYWMQEVYKQQFAVGNGPSKNEQPDPVPVTPTPPLPPAVPEPEEVPDPEPMTDLENEEMKVSVAERANLPEHPTMSDQGMTLPTKGSLDTNPFQPGDEKLADKAKEITAAIEDVGPDAPVPTYSDRESTPVAPEDVTDYEIYVALNKQKPFERSQMLRSKEVREGQEPGSWKLPE